jgi:hypothetical protein
LKHARLATVAIAATAMAEASCSWIAGVSGDVEIVGALDAGEVGDADAGEASKGDGAPADVAPDGDADVDPTPDASPEASDVPDGGITPNATTVMCAKATCTDKQEVCCYTPSQATCQQANATNCGGGAIARCDEAIDCDSGQVCCVTAVRYYGLETACKATCDVGQPQACRAHSECPAHNCVPWPCAKGTAETCAGLGSDAGCQP